ncbi:MAG: NAD(P)-binding protein [Proteobacteria bacterium]|nr:NAD(P)-binding protein [Pseudomonadota bacterium]
MNTGDTEVIIIGAGLGGLTSAILLGQMGIKVTVIERSPFPGGLLRSYARQGVDCAVGLHYFGPAGEGELLRQMFDILGVTDKLKLRRIGTQGVLERYIFDDVTFDLPSNLPAFKEALLGLCPTENDAIDAIIAALQTMSQGLRLDEGGRLQSSPFSFAGLDQSMEEFLAAAGCSKKLHDILTVHGFWTGLPMDKCPAYLLLYTLGALLLSAWELGCTGRQMADAYSERALATGADLILGDPVEHILVHDGRACGVRLRSGRSLTCKKIVAGIHPKLVLPMLPEGALSAAYKDGLLKLAETGSAVCVHLLVDEKQQEARGYNIFRIHKIDGVHTDGTFLQVRQSGRSGYNLVTIIRGSEYSDWKQWYDTFTGKRDGEYNQAKMKAAQSMIEIAGKVLGPLGDYTILDISTPLTLRDWAASPEGSIYGLMRSVTNDLQFAVLTRMPVRSLYLVGQNAIAPGLLGVTLSILRGVGEVAGRGRFQKFLAEKLAEKSSLSSQADTD